MSISWGQKRECGFPNKGTFTGGHPKEMRWRHQQDLLLIYGGKGETIVTAVWLPDDRQKDDGRGGEGERDGEEGPGVGGWGVGVGRRLIDAAADRDAEINSEMGRATRGRCEDNCVCGHTASWV